MHSYHAAISNIITITVVYTYYTVLILNKRYIKHTIYHICKNYKIFSRHIQNLSIMNGFKNIKYSS